MQHKPETILAAASSVFLSEGVSASTAKIATAAGVSNGTLFNYFPTKQALVDALYVSIKTDMANTVGDLDPADPIERRMRLIWDRWLAWARNNPEAHLVVNLLHQSGLASPEAQAMGTSAVHGPTQVLLEAQASGLLVDLPLEHLGALIQHNLDQAVASGLDDRDAELAYFVLWNGITQDPPAERSTHD